MSQLCSNCGAQVPPDKYFCARCEAIIERETQQARAGRSPNMPAPPQYAQARAGQQPNMPPPPQYAQARAGQPPYRPAPQQYAQARSGQQPYMPAPPQYAQPQYRQADEPPPRKKRKAAAVILTILILLVVAAGVAWFYLRSALSTAPDMRAHPRGSDRVSVSELEPPQSISNGTRRNTDKYTFLVMGADYGEYNTDVIMAVTFNAAEHTLDVVNIPRDTLVNVSWNTKKANSILANMRARHRGEEDAAAMQATIEEFANVLGYEADYWVFVNIQAFVSLVDAIGGVDFNVPVNMNYDDRAGGLSIHYSEGMHHLSGQQALEVLRFRSGYSNADIGRIGTQQSFLQSAAEQILDKKDSISVIELAGIFLNNVKTDAKLDDLIWFGREFLRMDAENINFHILPGNTGDSVRGQSYVTIHVDDWLELLNSTFNPFNMEITKDDVSILTRGSDRRLYVTDGNRQGDASWGS